MPFTVAEAARLERSLLAAGSIEPADVDSVLRSAHKWFTANRNLTRTILDSETFALLCGTLRSGTNSTAKALAGGALRIAQQDATSFPHRAGFAVRFAAHRIRSISNADGRPSSLPFSERERTDAESFFEAAIGDRSYEVTELLSAADEFIQQYLQDFTIFGRLAADLQRLVAVLTDTTRAPKERDIARAALTYFVVSDDAIPDELGFVGLFDDIYIIRRAIELIQPKRALIVRAMDEMTEAWPFAQDLRFDVPGADPRPISEFVLSNCSLFLSAVRNPDHCAAIVTSETSTLATLLGIFGSLSLIRGFANEKKWPSFEKGEHLLNVEAGTGVIFEAYGTLAGSEFQPTASSDDATHFCFFAKRPARNNKGSNFDVKCVRRIEDVLSFKRAGAGRAGGSGSAVFSPDKIALGVLERIFGSSRPIILPPDRQRVLVVNPFAATKGFLQSITVYGKPVLEIIPTGHARVTDGRIDFVNWTRDQDSHGPVLTFTRSPSEAAAITDDSSTRVSAVICPVKPQSADTTSLIRIASQKVPVFALMQQGDIEAAEHFKQSNFRCWVWDRDWLEQLRWMDGGGASRIVDFERRVLRHSRSRVETIPLNLTGLNEAHSALRNLQSIASNCDDELLRISTADGFALLIRVCRIISPVNGSGVELERDLSELRRALRRGEPWWPHETAELCRTVMDGLEATLSELKRENPKSTAIAKWFDKCPEGELVCSSTQRVALQKSLPVPARLVDRPTGTSPVLIPAWLRREKMCQFMYPPAALETFLMLYGPECEWRDSANRRHQQAMEYAREFSNIRPAMTAALPVATSGTPRLHPQILAEPEDIVIQARRSRTLNYIKSLSGEHIPAFLVQFAGGHWMPFTELHRVHIINRTGDNTLDEEQTIQEVAPFDLTPGDLVLIVRGTDKDVLREAVDQVAPTGLRDSATTWQRALRRFARTCALDGLANQLASAGCHRTRATIERWLDDDSIIGPRTNADVQAILTITSDVELARQFNRCLDSIAELRGLHLRVAQALGKRVFESARESLGAGIMPDELIEIEDRLVLAIVESVDHNLVNVPRAMLNRLQEHRPGATTA